MHVFEPDRPYYMKQVQKIKDKFREWDIYKVKTVLDHMREQYTLRAESRVKVSVALQR
jgi:hypothetical protein